MSGLMRALLFLPILTLALASCGRVNLAPPPRAIASVTGEEAKITTAGVAAIAHPDQDPTDPKPALAPNEVAPGIFVKQYSPANTDKRFEVVEITVDIRQPRSQSKLVPYLMNLDEWMLTKCIHISPMEKYYRFQRIIPAGTQVPRIDPFNRKPPEPRTGIK